MGTNKSRVHSSLDRLPKRLSRAIDSMYIDNKWPTDFQGPKSGKPRYVDIVEYCRQQGHQVHISSVGRHCRQLTAYYRMKEAGVTVRHAMQGHDEAQASATQKAGAEMLTAMIIKHLTAKEDFTAKELKQLSAAIGDCNHVVLAHEKYVKELARKQIKTDLQKVKGLHSRKQIDPETLKAIREQVYGIVDDHLGLKSR